MEEVQDNQRSLPLDRDPKKAVGEYGIAIEPAGDEAKGIACIKAADAPWTTPKGSCPRP